MRVPGWESLVDHEGASSDRADLVETLAHLAHTIQEVAHKACQGNPEGGTLVVVHKDQNVGLEVEDSPDTRRVNAGDTLEVDPYPAARRREVVERAEVVVTKWEERQEVEHSAVQNQHLHEIPIPLLIAEKASCQKEGNGNFHIINALRFLS